MTVNHLREKEYDNKPFTELLVVIAMRSMMKHNDREDKDAGEEGNISSIDQTNT